MQTGMTKGVNENESDECTRNNIFCDLLTSLGVDEKTAMDDACRMEHAVSKKSFWPLCGLLKISPMFEQNSYRQLIKE